MAVKKIRMRPEGVGDYSDIVYPMTSVDIIDGMSHYSIASGTNTYVVDAPNITSYKEGVRATIKFTNANTGASTLNINGLGAKSITKPGGGSLNIKAGGVYTLVYDGTSFQLQGEGGDYGTAQASHVLSGYTIGTDDGLVNGTMPNYSAVNGTATKASSVYMYKAPIWNDVNMLVTVPSGYYSGSHSIGFKVPGLTPNNIKSGEIISSNAPNNSGLVGTFTGVGTAGQAQVLSGYTFSNNTLMGASGSMVNRGSVTNTITTQGGSYTIPSGYHSGSGRVTASFPNHIASNIRAGVNIGGVVGTLVPSQTVQGTVRSSTDTKRFVSGNASTGGGTVSSRYVSVSRNFGFTPSFIMVYSEVGNRGFDDGTIYLKDVRMSTIHADSNIRRYNSDALIVYRSTAEDASISSSGFTLPVKHSNINYSWIAIA